MATITADQAVRRRDAFLKSVHGNATRCLLRQGESRTPDPLLRDIVLRALSECEIVIWDKELLLAAGKDCNALIGLTYDDVKDSFPLYPVYFMVNDGAKGDGSPDDWLYIPISLKNETRMGFGLAFPIRSTHPDYDNDVELVGEVYPDNSVEYTFEAWLVAQFAFMSQTLAATRREELPRNMRRDMERKNQHIPEVKRVVLRRKVYDSLGVKHGPTGSIDWSCSWLVRGHWRKQYCPSTGTHKPIYVNPYVKGPEDMPLRTPAATIFDVRR